MEEPTNADYARIMFTLFERFEQAQLKKQGPKLGRPYKYEQVGMIILFTLFQFRRIHAFAAQQRWVARHPKVSALLGLESVPCRTTLSRRYRALYEVLQAFICFIGQYAEELDVRCSQRHLVEDKSLFKALGPVWHQSDRKMGRIPQKLCNLDTDATWSKSAYQGWVYGYGLHLTCTETAFPVMVQVETAAFPESSVIDQKAEALQQVLQPDTVVGDNKYTKAMRIRRWAKAGIALITPAHQWQQGRYAKAYHRFLRQPDVVERLRRRRTSVEPLFDLVARVLGNTAHHKRLPIQRIGNVRTCLALAVLSVQVAMIVNSIWNLPFRSISGMHTAFT